MDKHISNTRITRKGAEFSSSEAFNNASVIIDSTDEKIEYAGIPIDSLENNKYVTTSDELHCFIVGESGSGKTRRIIVPSIHLLSKTGQSMVISDPKGELYRKTSSCLVNRGYDVKVINMRNPRRGSRWNPFTLVEKLYNSGREEDKDRALMIIEDITSIMLGDFHSDKDPYWENIAISYIKAIIFIMLEFGEKGSISFESISKAEREITKQIIEIGKNAKENNQVEGYVELNPILLKFLEILPTDSQILENIMSVVTLASVETTLNCVISSTRTILSKYTRQSTICYLLSDTDFDIEELGKKPMALFIILPDDSDALYSLATLMVNQIYSSLVNLADSLGGKLPNHVNFILDEFANFTKMNSVGSLLTASRSRGIRFILVCQNVGQLEEKYGVYGAETIRSNCRVWIFMGCRNLEFLKMLRDLSGVRIEKYSGEQYPLIDIDMLQTLAAGEVFVWNDRCSPKLCYLPDYSKYNFGSDILSESELPPYNDKESEEKRSILSIMYNAVNRQCIQNTLAESLEYINNNDDSNSVPF